MEIVERDALIVVGLPVRATWQELWVEMPRFWQTFKSRYEEIAHRVGDTFVDVSLEKKADEYVQLICSEVSLTNRIPSDMIAVEIPSQRYIYHRHVGPTKGIATTFGMMYDWARSQGHDAGEFKLDRGYTSRGDENEHDLFVGLAPEKSWHEIR